MPATSSLRLLAGIAALALVGALALQYLGGLRPCTLCIWARYPYLVVIAAALAGLWLGWPRPALAVIALALTVSVGLAIYHVGVEQGVFALMESCAAVGEATTVAELKAQLLAAPARCDEVPLTVLGLSLAAWNGVLAALLLVGTLATLLRSRSATEQHGQRRPA
jgi:disulfide bond formation protein DsbB